MTDTQQPGMSFHRRGVAAAPERAVMLRHEFSDWLHHHFVLDPAKASEIVLAVNEALANAAEYAYADATGSGVMHMHAGYDQVPDVLTVTVTDEGSWRPHDVPAVDPARGRGIPLMHALTDRAVIDFSPSGTQVCLQWDHIGPPTAGPARGQDCGNRTT
jgi:anti-sigma regulatory factor (Ser/Thr protein kinase)